MLAVIIPYFKVTFLKDTLESLVSQTDKRFKVYIGDDASPENPLEILDQYIGKLDFEYQRFDQNLGLKSLTKQWERCIALSKNEEWVMILGDDDVLGNNFVEEFYNHLEIIEETASKVVRYATFKIDEKGNKFSKKYEHPTFENSLDLLLRNTRSSLSEYIFEKRKLLKTGFKEFPLAWYSDLLAVIEISEFKKIYTINEAVVSIRISCNSISGSGKYEKQKREAKFLFYTYLLDKKAKILNKNHKDNFLSIIAIMYFNDKKNVRYFLKISKIHFRLGYFKEYLLFLATFRKFIKK